MRSTLFHDSDHTDVNLSWYPYWFLIFLYLFCFLISVFDFEFIKYKVFFYFFILFIKISRIYFSDYEVIILRWNESRLFFFNFFSSLSFGITFYNSSNIIFIYFKTRCKLFNIIFYKQSHFHFVFLHQFICVGFRLLLSGYSTPPIWFCLTWFNSSVSSVLSFFSLEPNGRPSLYWLCSLRSSSSSSSCSNTITNLRTSLFHHLPTQSITSLFKKKNLFRFSCSNSPLPTSLLQSPPSLHSPPSVYSFFDFKSNCVILEE